MQDVIMFWSTSTEMNFSGPFFSLFIIKSVKVFLLALNLNGDADSPGKWHDFATVKFVGQLDRLLIVNDIRAESGCTMLFTMVAVSLSFLPTQLFDTIRRSWSLL
ncbi:hypothetical protein CCP3SC1_40093 [Gammaproteobacteria bacterium]